MVEEFLSLNADESIRTNDMFGQNLKKMSGIAGTFHLTSFTEKDTIIESAWNLSKGTGKPVIIVVRA